MRSLRAGNARAGGFPPGLWDRGRERTLHRLTLCSIALRLWSGLMRAAADTAPRRGCSGFDDVAQHLGEIRFLLDEKGVERPWNKCPERLWTWLNQPACVPLSAKPDIPQCPPSDRLQLNTTHPSGSRTSRTNLSVARTVIPRGGASGGRLWRW